MGESKYKKCPRCELNWIKSEEEYCDVCKAELHLVTDITLLSEDDVDEDVVLCPVCKRNYIGVDEEMCEQCLADMQDVVDTNEEIDEDNDESWKEYVDDASVADDKDDLGVIEGWDEEDEEEEEEYHHEEDDDLDDFGEVDMDDYEEDDDLDLDDDDDMDDDE